MVFANTAYESPQDFDDQNFDEFQNILERKDEKLLYRMSFDELQNNTISTESGQIAQKPPSYFSPVSHFPDNLDLNATMSKKILDQMRIDFVARENVNQSSLKEATIEDLMVRAGKQDHIEADAQSLIAIDPMEMSSHKANSMPLQMHLQMPIGINCSDLSVHKSVSEICYSEEVLPLGISLPITCSSKSQVVAGATERKRRYSDDKILKENVEKKQKRMIKNRESAARSRARKQEHTKNMEDERDRLERSNCWLKKIKVQKRTPCMAIHLKSTFCFVSHA